MQYMQHHKPSLSYAKQGTQVAHHTEVYSKNAENAKIEVNRA